MYLLASKFRFLELRLLLSRVAPYYSSLPRTVWYTVARDENDRMQKKKNWMAED